MADRIEVDMIVEAIAQGFDKLLGNVDKAGKTGEEATRRLESGNKKAAFSFTELNSVVSLVTRGLDIGKQIISETAGAALDLGMRVKDAARAMGTSAEEASALLQVADDLRVSEQTLKIAFRQLNDQGIAPNIANLKKLQIEYRTIKDPVMQAQFAAEKFGQRAGPEMQKLLEATPEAIDEITASAKRAGLIMSEEAVAAAEEYRLALDALNDTVEGTKVQIGSGMIPILTDFIKTVSTADRYTRELHGSMSVFLTAMGLAIIQGKDLGEVTDVLNKVLDEQTKIMPVVISGSDQAGTKMHDYAAGLDEARSRYQPYIQAIYDHIASLDDQARAEQTAANAALVADRQRQERLGILSQLQQAEQDLATLQKQAAATVGADVAAALEKAGKKGKDLTAAYTIMDQVLGTNYIGQQNYNKALDEAIANFDPQHPEEFAEALEGLKKQFEDMSQPIQDAITKVDDFNTKYQALQGQHVQTYIDVYTIQHEGPPTRETQKPRRYGGEQLEASGGFNRPGDWAIVGERGPEPVYFGSDARVFSNEAFKQAMGGGDTYIDVTIEGAGQNAGAIVNEMFRKVKAMRRSGAFDYGGK